MDTIFFYSLEGSAILHRALKLGHGVDSIGFAFYFIKKASTFTTLSLHCRL